MPSLTSTVLAAVALLASTVAAKDGRTYAIVRHSGDPIVEARMDPIIQPGGQSSHTHTVFGGTGFSTTMGTDDALNAKGTTALVNGDKSNYWFPKLFFEADNGTFFPVKCTYLNTYYFFEATDDEIKAFPPGLRMVVGDPAKRSAPYTSGLVIDAINGQDTIQPVQMTCPRQNSGPALYVANSAGRAVDPDNAGSGIGFPSYTCDATGTGLRFDVHFPSCYNPAAGVANYQENMEYPSSANTSGGGKQNCPEGWIHTPHLFLEAYFDQTPFRGMWEEGTDSTPWRLAQGDSTGFGLHADFFSGWDTDDLQAMIDTCNAGFNGADKCPNLPSGVNTNDQVTITDPFGENLTGPLEKLPGCNPIQNGPAEATMYTDANCPSGDDSGTGSSGSGSSTASTAVAPSSSATTMSASSSTATDTPSSSTTSAAIATSTSTSDTSTPSLPSGWTSMGCYSDLTPTRVMTGVNLADIGGSITPSSCASYCEKSGFTMAGTEYGGQCFCGNDIASSSKALDAGNCNMACEGDSSQICGGSKALSVTKKGTSAKFRF